MTIHSSYDVIVVGAGVSGSFLAQEMAQSGRKTLVLEAGSAFSRTNYPRTEIDSNSRLYWGGGIELNSSATLGLLRPKVVGGGSIVNQALVDRFDSNAFDSWRSASGINFFNPDALAPWYEKAESELVIQEISPTLRNGNAKIFAEGFQANGFTCAPLKRAQKDCRFEDGNDCIECLSGCRIDSKQSMPVTTLRRALKAGCQLISDFEVCKIVHNKDLSVVAGRWKDGREYHFTAKKIILASGAIGNSKLLLNNGFSKKIPALGKNFYTHPQYMVLGLYDKEINAHKGPLQSYKSYDPNFRLKGFKLENVFAPPVAISMLIPNFGKKHLIKMKKITQMACIEVAVRDTNPGEITVDRNGKAIVKKELNEVDLQRKQAGMNAIHAIFSTTGAREIIPGDLGIGLHLMGGCSMGVESSKSVTAPDFTLHGHSNIVIADSSVFPNAPGINPSLTIMALAKKAAAEIIREAR
jgi:choline dehydrogenase-like flavoprotein